VIKILSRKKKDVARSYGFFRIYDAIGIYDIKAREIMRNFVFLRLDKAVSFR